MKSAYFIIIFILCTSLVFAMTSSERLKMIRELYEKNVISEEDYTKAKMDIIRNIVDKKTGENAESVPEPVQEATPSKAKVPYVPFTKLKNKYDIIILPFINETKRKVATDKIHQYVIEYFNNNTSKRVCPFDEILLYMGKNNMFYDFQENEANLKALADHFGAKYIVSGNIKEIGGKKKIDFVKLPFFSFGLGFKLQGRCSISARVWSPEVNQILYENSVRIARKREFLAIIQDHEAVVEPATLSCINTLFHVFATRVQ